MSDLFFVFFFFFNLTSLAIGPRRFVRLSLIALLVAAVVDC